MWQLLTSRYRRRLCATVTVTLTTGSFKNAYIRLPLLATQNSLLDQFCEILLCEILLKFKLNLNILYYNTEK